MARSDGLLRAAARSGRRDTVCSVTCGARGRGLSRAVGSAVTRPARKPGQSGGEGRRRGMELTGGAAAAVRSNRRPVATGSGSTAQSLNDDILRSVFSRLDDHFDLARCSAVCGSWWAAPPPPAFPFTVVLLVATISRSLRYTITCFVPWLILVVSSSMILAVNLCLLLVNSFGGFCSTPALSSLEREKRLIFMVER